MNSQNEEEFYILAACEDIHGGALLDIGAWDPITFSNSRALIERGWGAVLIEPSPVPLNNLVKEYGAQDRVKIVSACVGIERGWANLRVTEDAVSSTDDAHVTRWNTQGKYYGEMEVPVITLADITNRFGGFQFVNIDAEGLSVPLFVELMATEMLPRCVCVEHDSRHVELGQAAFKRGYRQSYVSQENCVFVRGK